MINITLDYIINFFYILVSLLMIYPIGNVLHNYVYLKYDLFVLSFFIS